MRQAAGGQRKEECGSFSRFALDPDAASVNFNDPLHEGKSNTSTIRLGIKLIEQAKDAIEMLGRNAHPIITNTENGLSSRLSTLSDLDPWLLLFTYELG